MDFPLGTRCRVEDVKYWGFTELGLQGREGIFLGGTQEKGTLARVSTVSGAAIAEKLRIKRLKN